jgi:hypothetical protein
MTPLTATQVLYMDAASMDYATALNDHISKLREELRIKELLLESVLASISSQTNDAAKLNEQIHNERIASAHHRPVVLDAEGQEGLLAKLEDVMKKPIPGKPKPKTTEEAVTAFEHQQYKK